MHLDLLPFLALSVLVIVIPGPDTAVVTKHGIVGGRRAALLASVGVAFGLTTWTVAAAFGIAELLRASAPAFDALKLAGAGYLIWIGLQMLRARSLEVGGGERPQASSGVRSLRQGFLSDLGNPKIAIFFTSFLPQFVHGSGPAFAPLLLLGGIFVTLTVIWLAAYSLAIGQASGLMRHPRVRAILDRVTGVILVGFGIRLAFEHR